MIRKLALVSLLAICQLYSDNPLIPSTPVNLTNDGSCSTSSALSATSTGFMTAFIESSTNNIKSIFSSDGQTWQSPVTSGNTSAYEGPLIAGNQDGFLATLVAPTVGFLTAAAYSIFSSDETTWNSPQLIEASNTIQSPIGVAGTSAGFLTSWRDTMDDNAYASFSLNDGTNWITAIQITNSGDVSSVPIVTAEGSDFLATWRDSSSAANASFSSDNGMSWSTPVVFTSSGSVDSDVWVGANSSGFMATWQDMGTNALSSFSNDNGASWTSPVQIGTGLAAETDVTVAGCAAGFVVAWIGSDSNAYGSFSSDHGATWSTPVQITSDGSVNTSNPQANAFLGLAALSNQCVFVWRDNSDNAISSFSNISLGPEQPANLSGVQIKNNFGLIYELFNQLHWDSSSSAVGYNVYRNGKKIATLNGTTLIYQDHNQTSGAAVSYGVSAFDSDGNVSSIATTVIN